MPKVDYTDEKKAALEMLSKDDLEKIQKDFPLKKVRDAKIYEILQRGFRTKVVSELSGVSYYKVWTLASYGTRKIVDNDLLAIEAAIATFNQQIKNILTQRKGNLNARLNISDRKR